MHIFNQWCAFGEIPLPGEMARRAKGVPPRQAGEPRRGSSPFLKIPIKKTNPITFGFDLISGAPSGTRTPDPLIKSQLLYQLS